MMNNMNHMSILSEQTSNHKFTISYCGEFTQDIINALLVVVEKKLKLDGCEFSTMKKIMNVIVECLQNISKHSDVINNNKDDYFLVRRNDTHYIIYSTNLIPNDRVSSLTERINAVNNLSKEELVALYMQKITEDPFTNRINAGLGIIDIAKKTGNKLEFEFSSYNEEQSYFTLKTLVSTGKMPAVN